MTDSSQWEEGSSPIPLERAKIGNNYRIYDRNGTYLEGMYIGNIIREAEEYGKATLYNFTTGYFAFTINKDCISELIPVDEQWNI